MRRLLAPVLLGVLVLTACGGDDTTDDAQPAPSASAAAPPDASAAGGLAADAPPFCTRYDEVLNRSDDPLSTAESPEAAADELRTAAGDIQDVAAEAPDEIEAPLGTVADASAASLTSLADLLSGEHGEVLFPLFQQNTSPETIPDDAPAEEVAARDAALEWVAAAQARYDEQMVAASQQVAQWYASTCQA